LLLDPAFQMNGTHRGIVNFCKEIFYLWSRDTEREIKSAKKGNLSKNRVRKLFD
jgi:hypothetical protein